MCHHINAKVILANYLKNNDTPLTFIVLEKIRWNILSKFDVYVEVEISISSMLSAVELHPEMFCWARNKIEKVELSQEFFTEEYIEEHINWELDQSIKDEALDAISSV